MRQSFRQLHRLFVHTGMSIIDDFISYLVIEQRASTHTVEAYRRDLDQFAKWQISHGEGLFLAENVTPSQIRAWVGSMADGGISPTSLRRKLQSLRAFYKWGKRYGTLAENPASAVVLPKKRKKLPGFIREEEIEEVLAPTEKETDSNFRLMRQKLIIEILYSLGLRQAELLMLTDADINFNSKEIKVTGKRNKQRVLPVPQPLLDRIKCWQNKRDQKYPALRRPAPLIAGPHGVISKQHLYRIVNRGLSQTSASKKSPHTLRHTFATAMTNNGADLDAVREMLGHSSLSTTQIYTHLSFRELLDNYRNGHPRANEKK